MRKVFFVFSIFFLSLAIGATCVMAQEAEAYKHSTDVQKAGGVKGLEQRLKHLEDMVRRSVEGEKWYDRIHVSGLVEVEAGYSKVDYKDPATEDEKSGDVDLANVELVFDTRIVDQVDGHIMLKYEDDDVFIDEGYIVLTGDKNFPAYLIVGRQYLPFGHFDSHFISDPTTLLLGETNEGAAVAGYRIDGSLVDLSLGVFNGRAQESGEDDVIDSFVARALVTLNENLMFGLSYTSNLASADAFNEVIVDTENLDSLVSGWSAFFNYQFSDHFNLIAEYVGAFDDFKAGELYDASDGKKRQPSAWNVELAYMFNDKVEVAVRYGGSDDGETFLPESEYGCVVNWTIFESTNLGIEYLHCEFEDDVQETDSLTAQLAIQF